MADLYETDVLEWSEHQSRLLRQHAAGQPGNEAPDWANVIEEVESVGRSQRDAVESLLTLAFLHDLKCEAWPLSRDVPHWQAEARLFRRQARRKFTSSMRARIDLAGLFTDAQAGLPTEMDGKAGAPVTAFCSMTLDEFLAEP